jgi:hypothetical protein
VTKAACSALASGQLKSQQAFILEGFRLFINSLWTNTMKRCNARFLSLFRIFRTGSQASTPQPTAASNRADVHCLP